MFSEGRIIMPQDEKPLVAITLGDVAGVGPEIAVRAWSNPSLHETCRPFVVGDVGVLLKALDTIPEAGPEIVPIDSPEAARPFPAVLALPARHERTSCES